MASVSHGKPTKSPVQLRWTFLYEMGIRYESVCVSRVEVRPGQPMQIWHHQPQDAARPEHTFDFSEQSTGYAAVEVFEHVRAVDDFHGRTVERKTASGIGPLDFFCARNGHKSPLFRRKELYANEQLA
jgi:hypothetical protein